MLTSKTILLTVLMVICFLAGCTSKKALTLMPTPVLFYNSTIDPFVHLTTVQKSTKMQVFYATNRAPEYSGDLMNYGNSLDTALHLGKTIVGMGGPDINWEKLRYSSLSSLRVDPVPLTVGKVDEFAALPIKSDQFPHTLQPRLLSFIDSINLELAEAIDKEIMIYVHGTKVDFANAVMLTAEIDHFTGRDFVTIAFAWPSHQNIFSYLTGTDVSRALDSSSALQYLLTLLSEYTIAEYINVLAYSAGGKVTSKALSELHQIYPELSLKKLKEKFRLGSVVFAAADVEVDVFLDRMTNISALADQVVITVTDNDNALKAAKRFMGGMSRAGASESEKIEEDYLVRNNLSNVEIVDVSVGKDQRGFDITGHHYWYRHPWMSSEIIFLLRTDLPPSRRGLTPVEHEAVWYLSADYPAKVQKAAQNVLGGHW